MEQAQKAGQSHLTATQGHQEVHQQYRRGSQRASGQHVLFRQKGRHARQFHWGNLQIQLGVSGIGCRRPKNRCVRLKMQGNILTGCFCPHQHQHQLLTTNEKAHLHLTTRLLEFLVLGALRRDLDKSPPEVRQILDSLKIFLHLIHKIEFSVPIWKLFPTNTWKKFIEASDTLAK